MSDALDALKAGLADRYAIERELGSGGMATVYLAEDLKHHRRVAIKVLRPELAEVLGADRFLREVRTTAQLHHPHILALFDSGQADTFLYYVMPYVEGESLRARLLREKQLPVEDALQIAREVADALSYAHTHGVVHRDIKPENLLLDSGHALVADFGVALAVETAGGERMTQSGVSIGTPQYMSPEQATGERSLDARADVYALGAVVYEMLTGDPPFHGATMQAILARSLTERPTAPSVLRPTVPPALDAAVFKALARAPADRFVTALAFGEALAAVAPAHLAPSPAAGAGDRRRALALTVGGLALGAALFFGGRAIGRADAAPLMRFGAAQRATWDPGLQVAPDISPDGKMVAYAAGDGTRFRIFLRPVSGGRPTPLTDDTTMVETLPRWSPDGSRILFIGNGLVFSAPSGGGAAREELPPQSSPIETAAWAPDGRAIVYAFQDSLFIRDAAGASRFLAAFDVPGMCTWGKAGLIACVGGNGWYFRPGMAFSNLSSSWIAVIDPATGRVAAATDSGASVLSPQWAGNGRTVLFISNALGPRDIYAVRVSRRGNADGPPRRLTVGLDASSLSLSPDGSRLAYAVMRTSSNVWSQPWSEAAPTVSQPRTQLTFGQHTIEGLAVSGDRRWLYFDSDASGNSDIYRMRLPSGPPERLTADPAPEFNPMPSPDGRSVVFQRNGSTRDIFIMPLDGGPVVQVTDSPMQEQFPAWSPDGGALTAASQSPPYGLVVMRREAGGRWTERVRVGVGHWPSWSPDGRYLSYATDLLGGRLRVVPVDSGAPRALYDESAPGAPLAETSQWSADGRTVFFKAHDQDGQGWLWSVPAAGGVPRQLVRLGDDRLRSDRFGFRMAGDRLYYALYDRQSNIWVMDILH